MGIGAILVDAWIAGKPIKRLRNKRRAKKGLPPLPLDEEEIVLQALKSKSIWLGILTNVWGVVQVFLANGDFSMESIGTFIIGVLVIIMRTVTTKPLDEK
jgi:hypothetical protein